MKFFEQTLDVKTSSVSSFATSVMNLFLLAPFRLVHEISKKTVYLQKKQIESVLFTATILAIGIAGANTALAIYRGKFSLLSGKMPLLIMIIGSVGLLLFYLYYSSKQDFLFDSLHINNNGNRGLDTTIKSLDNDELTGDALKDTLEREEVHIDSDHMNSMMEQVLGKEEASRAQLSAKATDLDSYIAPPNRDLVGFDGLQDFQNRLSKGIAEMINAINDSPETPLFSASEEQELIAQLDALTNEGVMSDAIKERFSVDLMRDEEVSLETEIIGPPEDFMLCS